MHVQCRVLGSKQQMFCFVCSRKVLKLFLFLNGKVRTPNFEVQCMSLTVACFSESFGGMWSELGSLLEDFLFSPKYWVSVSLDLSCSAVFLYSLPKMSLPVEQRLAHEELDIKVCNAVSLGDEFMHAVLPSLTGS